MVDSYTLIGYNYSGSLLERYYEDGCRFYLKKIINKIISMAQHPHSSVTHVENKKHIKTKDNGRVKCCSKWPEMMQVSNNNGL